MAPACGPSTVSSRRRTAFPLYCVDAPRPGWWNGRHDGLKNRCRKVCGFKSRPGHHEPQTAPFGEPFFVGSGLADGVVFRCRPRPSPPRLRASAIGFIPLFPYFAILRSKLREIDIELACPCQEEIEMRVLPAFFQVEKARKGGVRSPLREAHLPRGVCCAESALSETKPGKAKAIFSRSTSLPPSRHLPRQRRTARGDQLTGGGHFAPRLRAARDGTSPLASANPCASQSAREATPESASPSSRTPCPSSSRTHTHSRTAPTSR